MTPVLVDDMISIAGTVTAAVTALLEVSCAADITVIASHSLLVGPAIDRLSTAGVRRLITTDSVPLSHRPPFGLHVVSPASMLADAIHQLDTNRSLGPLLHHA